jgi:hypothetical protein
MVFKAGAAGVAPAIFCLIDLRLAIAHNLPASNSRSLPSCAGQDQDDPTARDNLQLLTPFGLARFAGAKQHLGAASTEFTELVNCEKKDFST